MYFAPCNLLIYNHSRLVLLPIQCLRRSFSNTYMYPIHATKVPQCFSVNVQFHNVAFMNLQATFYFIYLFVLFIYSKSKKAVKRLLKKRQNKDLNDKW